MFEFLDLVSVFDRTQHVSGPTLRHGLTLDQVVIYGFNPTNLHAINRYISDHSAVLFNVLLLPAVCTQRPLTNFCNVYQASQQLDPLDSTCSVEERTSQFMHRCLVTLGCVAPFKTSKNCSALTRPPSWVKEGHLDVLGGKKLQNYMMILMT